ncbi:uncharacterized protein G2W53_022053 [Senna tora]|uniref:Uncharacterized protein n=1 Tax=Senna tora TaxID=362788 RepID=A0A834WNV1_9FABA|nr:uncharacterized protein G2W53_022053 [Senna tora]
MKRKPQPAAEGNLQCYNFTNFILVEPQSRFPHFIFWKNKLESKTRLLSRLQLYDYEHVGFEYMKNIDARSFSQFHRSRCFSNSPWSQLLFGEKRLICHTDDSSVQVVFIAYKGDFLIEVVRGGFKDKEKFLILPRFRQPTITQPICNPRSRHVKIFEANKILKLIIDHSKSTHVMPIEEKTLEDRNCLLT